MKEDKTSVLDIVIAETRELEKRATDYLCGLLGLDVTKSKALGYNSSRIGLDEKLAILKELRTVDATLQRDITIVQEMRDKLAREWRVVDFMFYQDTVSKELRNKLEVLFEEKTRDGAGDTSVFLGALKRVNNTLHPLSWKSLAVIICREVNALHDHVLARFEQDLLLKATTGHDPVALTYYHQLQEMLREGRKGRANTGEDSGEGAG